MDPADWKPAPKWKRLLFKAKELGCPFHIKDVMAWCGCSKDAAYQLLYRIPVRKVATATYELI